MRKKLYALLIVVLAAIGLSLAVAPEASANIAVCGDGPYPTYTNNPAGCATPKDTGVYVLNSDTRVHYAWCVDYFNDQYGWLYIDKLNVGEYSERDCRDFDVLNRERVLYKSIATGTLYWSGCGQDLPYFAPRSPNGGFWQNVGNSVQIQKHVSYPTAPANVC